MMQTEEALYVLELDEGKWYVGRARSVQQRFVQHKLEMDHAGREYTNLSELSMCADRLSQGMTRIDLLSI